MPLDGVTTRCLTAELHKALAGARIDKIHSLERHTLFFVLRQSGDRRYLVMSGSPSAARIHLTQSEPEQFIDPTPFCRILRKHLSGGRIVSVDGEPFERILYLKIQNTNEIKDRLTLYLFVELLGRYSNCILTREDHVILECMFHVDTSMSRVREVMPARRYAMPQKQDKLSPHDAYRMVLDKKMPLHTDANFRPLEKALLMSIRGFSPFLVREICYRANLDEKKGVSQLTADESYRLIASAQAILSDIIEQSGQPAVYALTDGSSPHDFHALSLTSAGHARPMPSISEAIDLVYTIKGQSSFFKQQEADIKKVIDSALSHAERKKQIHLQDVADSEAMDLYKTYGQCILNHAHEIKMGKDAYRCPDDTSGIEITIPLSVAKTPGQNAQHYFKLYQKCKAKSKMARELICDDEAAIAYLLSLKTALENAADQEDFEAIQEELKKIDIKKLSKQKGTQRQDTAAVDVGRAKSGHAASRALRAASKAAQQRQQAHTRRGKENKKTTGATFREYLSPNRFRILCGRNNLQNDRLTKTAPGNDLWFHAQKIPGTHVILRLDNRMPDEADLHFAASIAAAFSQAGGKNVLAQAGTKIPVDYCPVKHVKKPSGAKPGMVVYDRYQTLYVAPYVSEKY